MGGVEGILGIPDPAAARSPLRAAKAPAAVKLLAAKDEVAFSGAAKELATAGQRAAAAEIKAAMREDKIRQAKESIEQGTYRVNDIVAQVAQRIGAYIE